MSTKTEQKEQKDPTCKERWKDHKDGRIEALRALWAAYQAGEDSDLAKETGQEYGELHEYGLSFDYVAPETFRDQKEGYWRYQISWGGPSDEFRFYSSGPQYKPYRVKYWFLDWFDGHGRALRGADLALMLELWDWFSECGTTEAVQRQALED